MIARSAVWLMLVCASIARAGAPFVTDGPEPVEPGHWEAFFASQLSHQPGPWSGAAPFIDANYGAADDLQVHLVVPMAFDVPEHGARHYGYGDTEVGTKVRFIEETKRRPQVGVYPLVVIPTGYAKNG